MKNKAFYTYSISFESVFWTCVLTWPCLALGLSCVLAKVWLEIFQPGSKSGSGSIPGPTGWSSLHSVVQLICCGLLLSQLSCSSPRCHQLYSCERGGGYSTLPGWFSRAGLTSALSSFHCAFSLLYCAVPVSVLVVCLLFIQFS